MAFITVSKSGLECLFSSKSIRKGDFWYPSVIGQTSTLNDWGDEEYEDLYDNWEDALNRLNMLFKDASLKVKELWQQKNVWNLW